jgi:diaminohydroxyphosphoribosylaminopyrimidine deaminase / 5-amino-6-(5-phosphoribosylamino)uracil reductase
MNARADLDLMEMAYGLAEKARGRTSPNPCVGAVVTARGAVVGWGHHEEAGRPHAEIVALDRAGLKAKGGTIYLTLEPCVHQGRTPPCVDRLLGAGLARAVVSAVDPNPLVNGRGLAALKGAGFELATGVLEERNRRLNEAYIKYITRKVPFVTLKAAVSLDGRIAARSGDSRWVSSPAARDYVHLLRGAHDAVLVGIGTILADDPRLTVRHALWKGKRIVRIVLDPGLRTPPEARILDAPGILIFADRRAPRTNERALEAKGAEVVRLPGGPAALDLRAVLGELGKREIASVLVEGGSRVHTSFIEARLADKLVLALSPKLVGGRDAVSFFEGPGVRTMAAALKLSNVRSFPVGGDRMIEGYL